MPALPPLRWIRGRLHPGPPAVLLLILLLLAAGPREWLERRAYDHALASAARPGSEAIVLVAIDTPSQARLGAWPWSRELHGRLVERLRAAGARVVVLAEPFVGPESPQALAEWHRIARTVAADPALARHPELPAVLSESREQLDGDARLARSLAEHGRSLLALGPLETVADEAPAALVERAPTAGGATLPPWPPLPLVRAALDVGHFELAADSDGTLRRHALRQEVDGRPVASLAWLAVQAWQHADAAAPSPAHAVAMPASARLPRPDAAPIAPIFSIERSPHGAFALLSARSVLEGPLPGRALAGKLVLVGRIDRAARLTGVRPPDGQPLAPVEALAHLSSALLTGQLVAQPAWAAGLPWLLTLGILAYLLLLAPRMTAGSGLLLSVLGALGLLLAAQLTLSAVQVWSPMVLPAALLLSGHLAMLALQRRPARAATALLPAVAQDASADAPLPLPSAPAPAGPGALPTLAQASAEAATPVPALPRAAARAAAVQASAQVDPMAQAAPDASAGPSARVPLPVTDPALLATQPLHPREAGSVTEPAAMYRSPPGERGGLPRLGAYQLEREIGRGTMGRVYLASEIGHGGEVAVKTLALAREFEGFALREARARFQREALAASRLQHPDIVRVLQSGEERGLAYLAMERLQGHDLTHHVQPGSLLSVGSVVAVGARVAAALAHAHRQGVIHRDIKPANVMIDPAHGQVKVTDFGIARITDAARTRTGLVLGSPLYMSPEQLTGREVDGRSDLYSLGVLLFQLLTGQLPHQGRTLAEMIQAVSQDPAPDLRSLRPELPAALADIVDILLQKRPALRYADGDALAADLRLVGAWLARERRQASQDADRASPTVHDCAPGSLAPAAAPPRGAADGAQSPHRPPWTVPEPRS